MSNIRDVVEVVIISLPLLALILWIFWISNDWRKCPEGGYHKWEYKEDLKVATGWLSDVLMNINGHNIYSTNKRHICKKCGLIEKIQN